MMSQLMGCKRLGSREWGVGSRLRRHPVGALLIPSHCAVGMAMRRRTTTEWLFSRIPLLQQPEQHERDDLYAQHPDQRRAKRGPRRAAHCATASALAES